MKAGFYGVVPCGKTIKQKTGKALKIAVKTNGKFSPGKVLKDLTAKPLKATPKAKVVAKKEVEKL